MANEGVRARVPSDRSHVMPILPRNNLAPAITLASCLQWACTVRLLPLTPI